MPLGTPVLSGPIIGLQAKPGLFHGLIRVDRANEYLHKPSQNVAPNFTSTHDGRLIAGVVHTSHALCLIETDQGLPPIPLRNPGRYGDWVFTHLAFSADSTLLVTAEEHERRIKIWDVASGELVADRAVSGGSARFAFAPDGRHLAVTEDDKTVVSVLSNRVSSYVVGWSCLLRCSP